MFLCRQAFAMCLPVSNLQKSSPSCESEQAPCHSPRTQAQSVGDAIYRIDIQSLHQAMPDVFVRDNNARPPRATQPAEALAGSRAGQLMHSLALEHVLARLQNLREGGLALSLHCVVTEQRSACCVSMLCPAKHTCQL